jgi:hypothetical protein
MYLCGGSPDFFNLHIWTAEVIPYNVLNSEFANFETPSIHTKYVLLRITKQDSVIHFLWSKVKLLYCMYCLKFLND